MAAQERVQLVHEDLGRRVGVGGGELHVCTTMASQFGEQ